MDNPLQRYVDMISEVTQGAQKQAEQVVRALVRRGEVEAAKGEKSVEGLLTRMEQNRKAVVSIVRCEIEDAVRRLGLARQSDIERLQAKIARLEAEVRASSTPVRNVPGNPTAGEPTSASADLSGGEDG